MPLRPPVCRTVPGSEGYSRIEVTGLLYDLQSLVIDVVQEDGRRAQIVFRHPEGFRVLDERELLEFWQEYHQGNGWLYEVFEGGWQELERTRIDYFGCLFGSQLREYFIVADACVNVLSCSPPEIVSLTG